MDIISLGVGLQSSALYFMSSNGELPRVDYAIFADPGREKKITYRYLEFMKEWAAKNNGIPIITVDRKNLFRDMMEQMNSTGQCFVSIPLYVKNPDGSVGMLRRQCTNEYKIEQVDWQIRQLYGLAPRKWTPKTNVWQGITLDEMQRMSFSNENWKTKIYPFCGYQATKTDVTKIDWGIKMYRDGVEAWFRERGLPVPPKSSCTFCTYQSDYAWQEMKMDDPEAFQICCLLDEAIRHFGTVEAPCYLHESCIPLREVKFNQTDIWRGNCATDCHI